MENVNFPACAAWKKKKTTPGLRKCAKELKDAWYLLWCLWTSCCQCISKLFRDDIIWRKRQIMTKLCLRAIVCTKFSKHKPAAESRADDWWLLVNTVVATVEKVKPSGTLFTWRQWIWSRREVGDLETIKDALKAGDGGSEIGTFSYSVWQDGSLIYIFERNPREGVTSCNIKKLKGYTCDIRPATISCHQMCLDVLHPALPSERKISGTLWDYIQDFYSPSK